MLFKNHIFLVHYLLQVRKVEESWRTVWHLANYVFSPQLLDSWWKRKPCMWSQCEQLHLSPCVQNLWTATWPQKYGKNAQIMNRSLSYAYPGAKRSCWPENWVIHHLLSYPHLPTEELSCAIHSLSRLPWRWHLGVVVTWMPKFSILGSCNVRGSHWLVGWLFFLAEIIAWFWEKQSIKQRFGPCRVRAHLEHPLCPVIFTMQG